MSQTQVQTPHAPYIQDVQRRVVGMYSAHPWPGERNADEEMGWRLRVLAITPEDFKGKRVLDLGSGTGEYALWYATHGAGSLTGVNL